MITCIDKHRFGVDENGNELFTCFLLSQTIPSSFPQTSDGIKNMNAGEHFAPGSYMIIVGDDSGNGSVYLWNGSGWYLWE